MGVGRSGTSTASRLLHNHFGICMGHALFGRSTAQPLGSFEDLGMMVITKRLVGIDPDQVTTKEWLYAFESAHRICLNRFGDEVFKTHYVGTKITHLSLLTAKQLADINPQLIIRTFRPLKPTIASLLRYRGKTPEHWAQFYIKRERNMDEMLSGTDIPVCRVEYPEKSRLKDGEIIEIMSPFVDNLNGM